MSVSKLSAVVITVSETSALRVQLKQEKNILERRYIINKIKRLITILITLIYLIIPISTYAEDVTFEGDTGSSFLDIFRDLTGLFDEQTSENEYDTVQIVSYSTSADVYINSTSPFNVRIEESMFLSDVWKPISYTNHGKKLTLNNLTPAHYYRIRVSSYSGELGVYEFYTRPENISTFTAEISENNSILLKWDNLKKYITEIYRKKDDETWEYITDTKESEYLDRNTEQGTSYQYRIRYKYENDYVSYYSAYSTTDDTYIQNDINNILNVNGYIIIRQNDPLNSTVPYPYKEGDSRTIGSSGCGVCAALMIVRNITNYEPTLESFTQEVIDAGGRVSNGSNIDAISKMLKNHYGLDYSTTKSKEVLEEHLKNGGMAIAHVGKKGLFTSSSGHFVVVAGLTIGNYGETRAIILDPSFYQSKYSTDERKNAGIEFSNNGIVTTPLDTLLMDCKDECITCFCFVLEVCNF